MTWWLTMYGVGTPRRCEMDAGEVGTFVQRHSCSLAAEGRHYHFIDSGPLVSRVMVDGSVIYVRSVDLLH
jgi:hypothetical protein